MTIFEKAEVLNDAGCECTDKVCAGIRCDECPYKELSYCKTVYVVKKLISMGYDVVIE